MIEELKPGDEVRLEDAWPGVVLTGTVSTHPDGCCLLLGPVVLVQEGHSMLPDTARITVTKKAPKPFYVNHDREEPVPGDVARDAESNERRTYAYLNTETWTTSDGVPVVEKSFFPSQVRLPEKLKLLVDGNTGQAVWIYSNPPEDRHQAHDVLDMS